MQYKFIPFALYFTLQHYQHLKVTLRGMASTIDWRMMNTKGFRRERSWSERDTHHRQDDVKRGVGGGGRVRPGAGDYCTAIWYDRQLFSNTHRPKKKHNFEERAGSESTVRMFSGWAMGTRHSSGYLAHAQLSHS